MTVFSGVVAILSPTFVSKFVKDAGRGDVLSKMQSEYGVTYMKTSEDICTIQGEWDAVNKVYSFLREAETGGVVDGRQASMPRDAVSSSAATTLKQRAPDSKKGQKQAAATLLGSSSDYDAPSQGEIGVGSDIQIVATWGNFSEDALPFFPPGEGSQTSASTTSQPTPTQAPQVVQILDSNGVPIKAVPGRSLLKTNIFKVETTKSEEMSIVGSVIKSDTLNEKKVDEKKPKTFVLCQPVPLKRKNKPAVAKKSTAKKAKFTILKKSPLKVKIDKPKIKSEPLDVPVIKNEQNSFELENTSLGLTEGMYGCESCTKVFMEKPALEVHTYVYHNSECSGTNIQCPYCQKVFLSKNGLEEHMYNHVGTRPFACHLCSTSFNHRKSLRRHMETHQDLKKYPCLVCEQSFTRKESLDAHIAGHGKDYTSFRVACKLCNGKFTNMGAYKKHMKNKHPESGVDNESLEMNESHPQASENEGEPVNIETQDDNVDEDTETVDVGDKTSVENVDRGAAANDSDDADETELSMEVDVDSNEKDSDVAENTTSVTDTSTDEHVDPVLVSSGGVANASEILPVNESTVLDSPSATVTTSDEVKAASNVSHIKEDTSVNETDSTPVKLPDKKSKLKKSLKKSPKPKATSTPNSSAAKPKEPLVAKIRSARICERRQRAEREKEMAEKGQRAEREALKGMMEEDGKASGVDGHVKAKKLVNEADEDADMMSGVNDNMDCNDINVSDKVAMECHPELVGDLCLDMEDSPAADAITKVANHSTTSDIPS